MNKKEKIDHFKFLIDRYDHYYEGVNTKASVYLGLNTFLLGGMITGYYSLISKGDGNPCLLILMAFTIASNIFSILASLWAVKPYLNTAKDNVKGSLIYFGDISCYPFGVYQKLNEEYDEIKLYEDLEKQVHLLSIGLKAKFHLMKLATYFLATQILLLAIISFTIIKK